MDPIWTQKWPKTVSRQGLISVNLRPLWFWVAFDRWVGGKQPGPEMLKNCFPRTSSKFTKTCFCLPVGLPIRLFKKIPIRQAWKWRLGCSILFRAQSTGCQARTSKTTLFSRLCRLWLLKAQNDQDAVRMLTNFAKQPGCCQDAVRMLSGRRRLW